MKIKNSVYLICLTALLCAESLAMSEENQKNVEKGAIRVLIVDGFGNHYWEQTTRLVRDILDSSGLFNIDVSTTPATKEAEGWDTWRPHFSNYDVVIQSCNSLGGGPIWPREVESDLEAFVSQGGGLYILHSGNNSFAHWGEYNRMIGLGWRNKKFGVAITIDAQGSVQRVAAGEGDRTGHGRRLDTVLTRLGDHPIHSGLPKRWKAADLEIYRYARGPAENLSVLSYALEPKTGLNFPIEWVVGYDSGSVYNSTFGHVWEGDTNPPGIRCVAFQTLFIRAMEWLSGREVTWPVPDNFPDDEQIQLQAVE